MIYQQYQNEADSDIKVMKVYQNGQVDQTIWLELKVVPEMTFQQIQQQIERSKISKGFLITHLRLFTEEGVEIYQDDLQFLKQGYTIYASFNGEEFDSSSGIQQYQIIKLLGQGGFGKVLLGQHKVTKQKVAIKIVNTASIGNAEDIDMVFREAEMMKSLVHRNIVKIFNCFTLSNMQVVYVMEYLEGGELLQFVQQVGRVGENEAREFFLQISEAIQYCHSQKLIHRDLKLENILLASKDNNIVKIVDFGIAGVATNLDVSKINAGSLKYMAPELFLQRLKKIGPHIDIWALGVILYGMIYGNLPFDGVTQDHIIGSILTSSYNFPRDLPVSLELKDLISRIFNPDFSTRIKLSDILQHPWCLGQVHDQPSIQRVLQAKQGIIKAYGVTLGLAQSSVNLKPGPSKSGGLMSGQSKLGSGPSKPGLMSGPSKLGTLRSGSSQLQQIEQQLNQLGGGQSKFIEGLLKKGGEGMNILMMLQNQNSLPSIGEIKSKLGNGSNLQNGQGLASQKSALRNKQQSIDLSIKHKPVEIPIPENFRSLVDKVLPKPKLLDSPLKLELVQEGQEKRKVYESPKAGSLDKKIKNSSLNDFQSESRELDNTVKRRGSQTITKDYNLVLHKFKRQMDQADLKLIELKRAMKDTIGKYSPQRKLPIYLNSGSQSALSLVHKLPEVRASMVIPSFSPTKIEDQYQRKSMPSLRNNSQDNIENDEEGNLKYKFQLVNSPKMSRDKSPSNVVSVSVVDFELNDENSQQNPSNLCKMGFYRRACFQQRKVYKRNFQIN